ncbi:hypothetical protein EV683_10815 [Crenobacter luteus]|uniref:hypothetical protein n=1 Tax=Crenobacter luteus TaxID=1452487 RepID=UPI00104C1B5F|nr:hypothetical protein [Crenobacter luteus]TCP12569.1 hypothetical protein EV683_10815 [Crenobacter luteus]
MDIAALGHAPPLPWIRNRLAARGYTLVGADATLMPGQPDWQGLAAPGLLIDLDRPSLETARYRAALVRAVPAAYVELAGAWHPLGEHYGFMMCAAGDQTALAAARPLLDALSPLPGAWLAAGPAGAAGFVQRYLDALARACLTLPQDASLPLPDWPRLFDAQRALAGELVALSDAYWRSLDEAGPPDAALLAEFATPPALQGHYARALAGATLYAFGERGLLCDVLDRLWGRQAPPP